MLLVDVRGGPDFPREGGREWLGGVPNRLSEEVIRYPLIEEMRIAKKDRSLWSRLGSGSGGGLGPWGDLRSWMGLGVKGVRSGVEAGAAFGEVARRRRSALDFRGASESIGLDQLMTLLRVASQPRYVQLYLYVHRVRELEPGLYRYWHQESRLELLKTGDQRVMAAALSLGQDLAGNSCVTFSMIGDLERAAIDSGDRGYRYVHFEAGAIGQRLYLGAEALGFQSTGIGAFYDDAVHQHLEIAPEAGRQVVYHFACGYAVEDDRLVARDRELIDLE
jgi:SagB-type dehydrogenase family enzyme